MACIHCICIHIHTTWIYIYIYIYIYRNCILVWELLFKPAQIGLLDDPLTSALLGEGLERGFPCSMAAWGLLQNSLNRPRTPGARHSHTWHYKMLAANAIWLNCPKATFKFHCFRHVGATCKWDQMRCTNRIKSHQGTWWLGTNQGVWALKLKQTLPWIHFFELNKHTKVTRYWKCTKLLAPYWHTTRSKYFS